MVLHERCRVPWLLCAVGFLIETVCVYRDTRRKPRDFVREMSAPLLTTAAHSPRGVHPAAHPSRRFACSHSLDGKVQREGLGAGEEVKIFAVENIRLCCVFVEAFLKRTAPSGAWGAGDLPPHDPRALFEYLLFLFGG